MAPDKIQQLFLLKHWQKQQLGQDLKFEALNISFDGEAVETFTKIRNKARLPTVSTMTQHVTNW